jgi:hypothetical protein
MGKHAASIIIDHPDEVASRTEKHLFLGYAPAKQGVDGYDGTRIVVTDEVTGEEGIEITAWRDGDTGAIVLQIDTSEALEAGNSDLRIRVNINDGAVYDGQPETGHSYLLDGALSLDEV